ncbi:MAG TPA: PilZ domain-containing protein [Thermoanaerobaculia bacterium]|jgi:Tfp pilus assembly protein PilZ|nr:PilZ domain-containing protein [Thermoanaerobaculia bacterium]
MGAKMSRRRSARRPRRVSVQFWKQGEPHPYPGFTTNISMTGMFIGTRSPMPSGTRVRIEVLGEHGFMIEGVVAHARKARGDLARITQTGMGVRFLSVEDLVRELLPGASGGEGAAVGPPDTPPPFLPGDDQFEDIPEPPPLPELPPPLPLPQATPVRPQPHTAAPVSGGIGGVGGSGANAGGPGVFTVHFPSPRHFLDVFERDIKNGGLFVSTRFPGRLAEMVTIELHPPDAEPILVHARVVQRFEPHGASMLAGMGVELLDAQAVCERLRPIVARLSLSSHPDTEERA